MRRTKEPTGEVIRGRSIEVVFDRARGAARLAAAVALLAVPLLGGVAMAAEPPAFFCEGPPPGTSQPSVPPSAASSPHWRDLEVSLLLAVGVAGAMVYVVGNERRRPVGPAAPVARTPYLAGACVGGAFALSLLAFGRPVGVSAGVQQGARLIEQAVGAGVEAQPVVGFWPLWVVAGVAVGGAASARLRAPHAGTAAAVVDGESRVRTWMVAFGAGMLLQLAAAIAGGCTSGLALSGGIVLAPAAFIFMAGMFIGGIPTAWAAAHLHARAKGGLR
jgi:hypothetical protein